MSVHFPNTQPGGLEPRFVDQTGLNSLPHPSGVDSVQVTDLDTGRGGSRGMQRERHIHDHHDGERDTSSREPTLHRYVHIRRGYRQGGPL
jgi:hypothetical protein